MKEKYIAKHVTGVNTCSVPTGLLVAEVYVMITQLYIFMPLGTNETH